MFVPIVAALLTLVSSQFSPGGALAGASVWNRGGCTGANRSPALRWANPPARTRSFALSVFDSDAGRAGWWHWIVYDISPERRSFAAAVAADVPEFAQGINDFGTAGYGGPCPPPGPPHHYVFTLYALDIAHLRASGKLHGPAFVRLIRSHILATARLTGRYGRS